MRCERVELVSSYRRMTGKSQKYFADILGISINSYANKEKGKTQFTKNEMEKFHGEVIKYFPTLSIEDIFFSNNYRKLQLFD